MVKLLTVALDVAGLLCLESLGCEDWVVRIHMWTYLKHTTQWLLF